MTEMIQNPLVCTGGELQTTNYRFRLEFSGFRFNEETITKQTNINDWIKHPSFNALTKRAKFPILMQNLFIPFQEFVVWNIECVSKIPTYLGTNFPSPS
jgi:hypothetical protein